MNTQRASNGRPTHSLRTTCQVCQALTNTSGMSHTRDSGPWDKMCSAHSVTGKPVWETTISTSTSLMPATSPTWARTSPGFQATHICTVWTTVTSDYISPGVYRAFVHYEGWDDPEDTKHKQQAGPNGAENNHNICYAYSDDKGYTWHNNDGAIIASLKDGGSIRNDSPGIVVFGIPKGRGLTNQESQAIDQQGGAYILNRDTMDGQLLWKHYYRSPLDGVWSQRAIRPVSGGTRGRMAVSKAGDLYIILPEPSMSGLES